MIDQQNQQVYDEVSTAYADVRLERDAEDVIRRGRTLRRRRRAMPALAAAGVLAFSLSLAAVTAQSHSSSRTTLVNVDEAAFSVHTSASTGVVTITIRDFFDENRLKQILADAGIAAVFHAEKVTVTEVNGGERDYGWCHWVGATEVSADVATVSLRPGASVFTVYPSRMPHGSVLAFNYVTRSNGLRTTGAQLLSNTPTGCVD